LVFIYRVDKESSEYILSVFKRTLVKCQCNLVTKVKTLQTNFITNSVTLCVFVTNYDGTNSTLVTIRINVSIYQSSGADSMVPMKFIELAFLILKRDQKIYLGYVFEYIYIYTS